MYLRFTRRRKDGKEHRYWSIVESKRCARGRVVQGPVLYLGEINDSQREAWCRVVDAFDEGSQQHRQLALFPAGQGVPEHARGYGCRYGSMPWNYAAHGNGEPAGFRVISTNNWSSIGSRQSACRTRAKEPAGGISCRRWCATG
jgi:hypothetical protein